MVFSAIYYTTVALTRLALWLAERRRRPSPIFRKEEEERREAPPPLGGWVLVADELGQPELRWLGRHTRILLRAPALPGMRMPPRVAKPPAEANVRLHFLWTEAASDKWFEEIEALARLAEMRAKR